MSISNYYNLLQSELDRLDAGSISKRNEQVISGFTSDPNPKAIINGNSYSVFNSNDYLGLRHNNIIKQSEHLASQKFGSGPGAVRFISGSLQIYHDLETELAKFHSRPAAITFSSAFAANLATLFSLIKGQSKDSKVSSSVLVLSDELNHRSIVEGIRVANLDATQKQVYKHLDYSHLESLISENIGKFDRCLVVTDGVFSMLGELVDLKKIRDLIDSYSGKYPQGILLVVDDCHGIGAIGNTGRGTEEVCNAKADVLIGTLGKSFGCDGGYVVADKVVVDYLRESAATYIYSNPISPSVAGGALQAVKIVSSPEGIQLLQQLSALIKYFKTNLLSAGFTFSADSIHPIQPIFIGDSLKAKSFKEALFSKGFLVTNINYPVVPKGRDEIRVQLNATQSILDLQNFISACTELKSVLN